MEFQSLTFQKNNENLRVNLYQLFYFDIPEKELPGEYQIDKNEITFGNITEKKAINKFYTLIAKYITNLRTRLQDKEAVYIHENSNIPLIGAPFIGLVDRNTTCIEVKPITGCNIGCTFCSVDEGINSKKQIDFVVEKDYLAQEFKKLLQTKNSNQIEACINAHGEPTTYQPLADLIQLLSENTEVKTISLITNTTLLNEKRVDDLVAAGLTKFNLSINTLNKEQANLLANTALNLEKIEQTTRYAASKCDVTIAPVYLKNINESEMGPIIEFAKTIKTDFKLRVGIQNFLNYKFGRNLTSQMPWDEFNSKLTALEQKYDIKLLYDLEKDFDIFKTKALPKPFMKGDKIKATIVSKGRFHKDRLAVAKGRIIVLPNCDAEMNSTLKVKITGDKHNIFFGSS